MTADSTTDVLKQATRMSIGWAIAMLILGVVAILMPFTTGIAVAIFVGWIMVFSGFTYVAYAFGALGAGSFLWRLLVGVAYVAGGGYLAFHPGIGLESLTLVVASIFFAEGIVETVAFFQLRALPGSGWILFDGLMTLVLAYLIFRPWPASSTWVIGTLLGINLIVSGTTRLMYSVSARKTINAITA
jgi:uncharacterized membrane protein HdeD (DUF308 family)